MMMILNNYDNNSNNYYNGEVEYIPVNITFYLLHVDYHLFFHSNMHCTSCQQVTLGVEVLPQLIMK
jgi:hypothetical protein